MKYGWKTITGSILAAAGYVAQQGVSLESLIAGAGVVLAGFGIRVAITKRGAGPS